MLMHMHGKNIDIIGCPYTIKTKQMARNAPSMGRKYYILLVRSKTTKRLFSLTVSVSNSTKYINQVENYRTIISNSLSSQYNIREGLKRSIPLQLFTSDPNFEITFHGPSLRLSTTF